MRLLLHNVFESFHWDTWHFHLDDDACWVEHPIPDKKKQTIQWKWGVSIPLPLACKASALPSELHSLPIDASSCLLTHDATYTPTPQTDAKTVWPSGLRRLTWNQLSSGCVGSNPATVVFFFIPEQLHLCVSDGVDTDDQSKQDNVAEWLRRLPAKEFPFGA